MNSKTRRLFIALPVDDEFSLQSLSAVGRDLADYSSILKTVPADNYHITLKFFGEVDPAVADSLISDFRLLNGLQQVHYTLQGIGVFPSVPAPSVIWAGLKCDEESLEKIVKSVEILSSKYGFPPEQRKFVPHLTLARVKRDKIVPPALKKYILKEEHTIFSASSFRELVLFESFLSAGGPEYKKAGIIKLQ